MTATDTSAVLARLEAQRADLVGAAANLAAAGEKRRLTTAEEATWEGYLGDLERLDARAAAVQRPAVVTREPLTYREGGEHSYFADVAFVDQRPGARERLQRHQQEMDLELRKRREAAERAFDGAAAAEGLGVERRVNPNTTQGQGGYWTPPLWLIDEWGALGRSTRPLADMIPALPLPRGVQQIAIPRFTVNPTVAPTADAASIAMPDFTDASVTSVVRTISGGVLVAQQLADQAGTAGLDSILAADLAADYAMRLEAQLLNGSGSSGQLLGALNVSGITAVSYTDATPTVPELLPVLGQAYAQFGSNRNQPPEAWIVHPRRWGWMASGTDTTGRPFVDLDEDEPSIFGTPVILDGAMPITLSTNQDAILAVKASDMRLFESELTVGAAVDHSGVGALQVRLYARRYAAALLGRVPTAIAAVTGTGLAQVAGYG